MGFQIYPPLKLSNIAPENGWLEYDRFLFGFRPFLQGRKMLVLWRVYSIKLLNWFGWSD